MLINEKNFEDMKDFINSLYNPADIKREVHRNGDEFIENVLSLVDDNDVKRDITMLYSYYVENGSELVIKAIFEYASTHNLHNFLEVFPLNDDDVTGLVDQAVSNILFYDRKGDEEINIKRIEAHFKNNPDAIDVMVAKFRQSLEESLNDESEPEDLDDES